MVVVVTVTVILAAFVVLPTTAAPSWMTPPHAVFRPNVVPSSSAHFGHPHMSSLVTTTNEHQARVSNIPNTTESGETTTSSWMDRTMTRVVSILTYWAIGQGVVHLWHANRSEIATELAHKMFSQESMQVIQTIQSILSNVHTEHGVVDVFGKYRTMDALTSIVAFRRLQRVVVPPERSVMETTAQRRISARGNSCIDVEDAALVSELAHYANYAHAVYGWTLDLALRWQLHFGGNHQTLVRLTGIHRDDIVQAEWHARAPHRPAFVIVRDHARRAIVLCIRGTWSVNDMLTNLYCTSGSNDFFHQLFHRELSCHSGMLEAAKAVYGDVDATIRHELLENPEYSLVLTGHSLGGGCAALLGKLFEYRYPTLKVYLYGAPCVVPERNILSKNIISVIIKGDPFSCLSLGHIADVSKAIEHLCKDDRLRNDVLLRTRNMMNDDKHKDYNENMEWCRTTMQTLRKCMSAEKLYPPGHILLLSKNKPTAWGFNVQRLRWWRWRRRRRYESNITLQEVQVHYFRDLLISANMFNLSKHLPSKYISILKELQKETKLQSI